MTKIDHSTAKGQSHQEDDKITMNAASALGERNYGAANIDPSRIPPRTLDERVYLAIRWSRHGADPVQTRYKGMAKRFVRELEHVGLKLVLLDGSELTEAQLAGRNPEHNPEGG
jgi:hypothetical protein